ncbi:hypothetical protein ABT095_03155 [Kitasatospora sp. NPDC002227]|uniref:hypothetical protein n=1 Tax=Kitasatospora sp. NPDC002227 TaxID=3154773 RepID=UPI00331ADE54
MKRAIKAFLARFRTANGLDRDPDRFAHPDAHRRTPPPDQNLGLHYRPTGGGGQLGGNGGGH